MDFTARGAQPHPNNPTSSFEAPAQTSKKGRRGRGFKGDLATLAGFILLLGVVVVVALLIVLLIFGKGGEKKYLNTNNYQAVDISVGGSNGGDQIYFGKITNLSDSFMVIQNVFYIPASQNSSNITLEPLVCQIDTPYDQMIVNRSSVNWWENLQSSSQVVKSITNYEKTATASTTCPTSSNSTSSSNSTTGSTPSSTSSTTPSSTSSSSSSSTKP